MRRFRDLRARPDTGERSNALWGGTGKKILTAVSMLIFAVAVLAGTAAPAAAGEPSAYVTPSLLADASSNPRGMFDVIVQAHKDGRSANVVKDVSDTQKSDPSPGSRLKRQFVSVAGTSATLSGRQILRLSKKRWIASITLDTKIAQESYSSGQQWPAAAGVAANWNALPAGTSYPSIAVVDSGITPSLSAYGGRVIKSVHMVSSATTWGAYGHGSMVGTIAAGGEDGYTGAEPHANIVSIKVLDGAGVGSKSDVIAACDWILAEQGDVQHPRRQLLDRNGRRPHRVRPARQGRRVAVAERRHGGGGGRQLRCQRATQRRRLRPGERPVRDHGRSVRHERHAVTLGRLRRAVVGMGLHTGRLLEAGDLRTRAPHGRCRPDRGQPDDAVPRAGSWHPTTCGCRAPRSRHLSCPASRQRYSRRTRAGRPTRSRARSCRLRPCRPGTTPPARSASASSTVTRP